MSGLSKSVAAGSDLVKIQTSYHFFPASLLSLPGETNVREEQRRRDEEDQEGIQSPFLRNSG